MWLANRLFPSVRRLVKENAELKTALGKRARWATIPSPPPELACQIGGGLERGPYWLEYLKLSGLQPDHSLLDLGCGVGRLAIPLTEYLTDGTYTGLDVALPSIRWCQQNVTPRYPKFQFCWADLHNSAYNPGARARACDYRFPFQTEAFDWIVAISLFTHLQAEAASNYLRESARVLKPGGHLFATLFLLNDRSIGLIRRGESLFAFTHPVRWARVTDTESPDAAVAYDENLICREMREVGLSPLTVRYGQWVRPGADLQDVLIATRSGSSRL